VVRLCTVVLRWAPGGPSRVLALRDELVGRPFDDPDRHWPDQPDAVGGRDRLAGGSWCVTDVATGVAGLVLNRPERREAAPGAPSRGVLPLLATRYGPDWAEHVPLAGMASFTLLLVTPDAVTRWTFDGRDLRAEGLPPGTSMTTSGGPEDGREQRYLAGFAAADPPGGWLAMVRGSAPADDPAALLVRHRHGDRVFATVFGQLIEARPGAVDIAYSRTPGEAESWARRTWTAASARPGPELSPP
jgi:hypothetical protein